MVSSTHPTGAAASALLLARELTRAGHAIGFACREGPLADEARAAGLAVVYAWHFHKNGHPLRLRADTRRLRRAVSEGRIELVHCHRSIEHLIARLALGGEPRSVPLVRTYHEPLGAGENSYTRLLFRYATDRLAVITRARAAQLDEQVPGLAGRVHAVPGAVDVDRFAAGEGARGRQIAGIPPGRLVVGTVSKLAPERQLERVMEAFARVTSGERAIDAHLLLLGSGPAEPYRETAAALGIADRVTLRAGGEHFLALLHAIDVGIQLVPGGDGSGRAALELMAAGKPVIAAPVGGLTESVDAQCGRLVTSDDELTAALAELLADASLRASLGSAARRHVRARHALDGWVAAYERIYAEAARSPVAAPVR